MKNLILGLILGLLLGAVATGIAAMSGNMTDRKYNQYVETVNGKTALLITIAE